MLEAQFRQRKREMFDAGPSALRLCCRRALIKPRARFLLPSFRLDHTLFIFINRSHKNVGTILYEVPLSKRLVQLLSRG